jgi:hypothetical protein
MLRSEDEALEGELRGLMNKLGTNLERLLSEA